MANYFSDGGKPVWPTFCETIETGGIVMIKKKFIELFPATKDFELIIEHFNVQDPTIYLLALLDKDKMLELAKELEADMKRGE